MTLLRNVKPDGKPAKLNSRQIRFIGEPTEITGQLGTQPTLAYRFRLSRSSDIYLNLSDLAANANADLVLLKKRRILGRSANPGQASELIATNLAKGEYQIRVVNRSRSKTPFRLTISSTDPLPTVTLRSLMADPAQPTALTAAQLKATDRLQTPDKLRYLITETPRNGLLLLNGNPLAVGGSFTQADIDQGRVAYRSTRAGIQVLGNGTTPMVSGFNIVWVGPGGSDGGSDSEIFFFDGSTTRQLTQNTVDDRVESIDGTQVVWSSQVGGLSQGRATYELYTWDGNSTTRLTDNAVNEDFVGVQQGSLFWTSPVGAPDARGQATYEVFYAKAGQVQQLTRNAVNETLEDFQSAMAVWEADVGPLDAAAQPTSEIFFFNGSTVQQLTNNTVDDESPRIDSGRIIWSAKSGAPSLGAATSEIMLFDGGQIRQLTNNSTDDFVGDINGNMITWMSRTGPANGLGLKSYEIFRFDGTNTQRVTTNAADDFVIEASGSNLFWMGLTGKPDGYGQSSYELYVSDGSKTTQLTNNQVNDLPIGLIGSQAVWYSQTGPKDAQGAITRELFYYDGSQIRQLTNDAKNDDLPSFSAMTLAWRSTEGSNSQILRYSLGDQFKFRVTDRPNQTGPEQVFQVQYA
ncbi:MAG: cadherin-like domain-containing protein [Elainella sp.]